MAQVLPAEERPYTRPFQALFTLAHLEYVLWLAAIHGTFWGLIFSWTTLFGLLRDGMTPSHFLLWLIGFLLFLSCAVTVHGHFAGDDMMRAVLYAGASFFGTAMICTLTAGATSYFYNLGFVAVLPDVGFYLIPQAVKGSFAAKVSGVLATVSGLSCIARQAFTGDSRLAIRWFRCMTFVYLFRTCTMFLTALPGPASHCRGEYLLRPTNFWAVMGRLRAMYGGEENCGDLIYSGHTAFVTTSVLTLLHGSWGWPRVYKYLGWACGAAYILTFEYGVIAARKHYSVDVWLGFLVACFIYITFSNGWVPAFFKGFTL